MDAIVDAIVSAGRTNKVGDGKIIVYDLDRIVRIRTGEQNESAI